MREVEVAIVGGGPAGLALAMTLVQSDPSWRQRMVVLEKQHHPRHKLCGGGLTVLALKQLKRLNLKLDINFVRIDSALFRYHDHVIDMPGQPAFVVTRRSEFDHWLALQARHQKVPLVEGAAVEKIEQSPNGLTVSTSQGKYHTQILVGADGSKGVVRRWLVGRENPPHVARLLEFVTKAESDSNPFFQNNLAQFDFSAVDQELQGYFWDFPSKIGGKPHMNFGLYDGRLDPKGERAKLPRILEINAENRGVDPAEIELEGHPIHWFAPSNKISTNRVLLVGDAAGAEPLFGEGIGIALAHSRLAADEIQRALNGGNFGFTGYHRRLLLSPLGRYLLLRWLVAAILYRISRREGMMRLFWRLAAGVAWLAGSLPPVDGVLVSAETKPQ